MSLPTSIPIGRLSTTHKRIHCHHSIRCIWTPLKNELFLDLVVTSCTERHSPDIALSVLVFAPLFIRLPELPACLAEQFSLLCPRQVYLLQSVYVQIFRSIHLPLRQR